MRIAHMEKEEISPQLVVAIFDDWESLQTILSEISEGADRLADRAAVLHARKDVPASLMALQLRRHATIPDRRQPVVCTVGWLSDALTSRLAQESASASTAFDNLFGAQVGRQIARHLRFGHLVLCVDLRTPDEYSIICGSLVRASPHVVEVCAALQLS